MAHYITPDGRVQSFEAEVKPDGTVRPKNYHEFNKDDSSGDNPQHSAEPNVVKSGKRYLKANINDKSVMNIIKDEIKQYLKSLNLSQQDNTYLTALFMPCKIVNLSPKSIKKLQANYSNDDLIKLEKTINDLNDLLFRHDIGYYRKPIKVRLVPKSPDPATSVKPQSRKQELQPIRNEIRKYIDEIDLLRDGKVLLKSLFMPCNITIPSDKTIKKLQAKWTNKDLAVMESAINKLNELLLLYFPEYPKPKKVTLVKSIEGKEELHEKIKTARKTSQHLCPAQILSNGETNIHKYVKSILNANDRSEKNLIIGIDKLVSMTHLSGKAQSFLLGLFLKRDAIVVSGKLYKKIALLGLSMETSNIVDTINAYNTLIKAYNKTSKQVRSTNIGIVNKCTTDKEWASGNLVRKGPQPKYGYARDRFGRVQERDSYREDRDVNPYSSYSNYDSEDDHDSQNILD